MHPVPAVTPARTLSPRALAQAGELTLLRGVEQVDAGQAFERLQHRGELVGCLVAAPAGVAAAVEQIVDCHHGSGSLLIGLPEEAAGLHVFKATRSMKGTAGSRPPTAIATDFRLAIGSPLNDSFADAGRWQMSAPVGLSHFRAGSGMHAT